MGRAWVAPGAAADGDLPELTPSGLPIDAQRARQLRELRVGSVAKPADVLLHELHIERQALQVDAGGRALQTHAAIHEGVDVHLGGVVWAPLLS